MLLPGCQSDCGLLFTSSLKQYSESDVKTGSAEWPEWEFKKRSTDLRPSPQTRQGAQEQHAADAPCFLMERSTGTSSCKFVPCGSVWPYLREADRRFLVVSNYQSGSVNGRRKRTSSRPSAIRGTLMMAAPLYIGTLEVIRRNAEPKLGIAHKLHYRFHQILLMLVWVE